MKKVLIVAWVVCALFFAGFPGVPVRAAEEGAAPPAAKPEEGKEAPKDSAKKEGGGEGGEGGGKKNPDGVSGGRFAGDPVYVHLAPMVLPIITDKGVEQLVTVQIDIEVSDFDVADTVHSNMPRIMDALMGALYGGLGSGKLRRGNLVDISKVKSKATTALEGVVGKGGIKDVLIQGVAQRML